MTGAGHVLQVRGLRVWYATPKGPLVGQVLREVEDWWIDHDFIDDKLSAVEKLKSVVQGMAF